MCKLRKVSLLSLIIVEVSFSKTFNLQLLEWKSLMANSDLDWLRQAAPKWPGHVCMSLTLKLHLQPPAVNRIEV